MPMITRRDFLNGVAITVGTAPLLAGGRALAQASGVAYPPALMGLRGAHPGSFEVAHALAFAGQRWPEPVDSGDGPYDLVVAGGGISGLAAAWFYRRERPQSRILILDNHDDFGGHAKRNEFTVDGETLIAYGGSQSIDTPSRYSAVAKELLTSIGIEVERFYRYFDRDFYSRLHLRGGIYFDAAHYSETRVLANPFRSWGEDGSPLDTIEQFPIAAPGRAALRALLADTADPLQRLDDAAKLNYLRHTSYEDVLVRDFGLTAEAALVLRNSMVGFWGVGWDAVSANQARTYGMPGTRRLRLHEEAAGSGRDEPYIFHFPDGNAAIAWLLVRKLVEGAAAGSSMEDIVTARLDYGRLDRSGAPTRIRLSSTVVEVRNIDGASVDLVYVRGERAYRVRARHAVLAGFNRMLPYICPEMPPAQREALSYAEKVPLVYVNVALRNWRAFADSGFSRVYSPQDMFAETSLDFPVSLGGYRFSSDPSRPIVVHMVHVPTAPGSGLNEREQHRIGRARLLSMSFDEYESAIRRQLDGILGRHGFDHERDIAGITVNRWPHGYAYEYNELFDPQDWSPEAGPHVAGRARLGRMSIANSDSEAHAYADAAIDAAHRAVQEQLAIVD